MSNHRASLLSGLRTGGVRSSSNPAHMQLNNGAYTAAIGGQFPRHASSNYGAGGYSDAEDLADRFSQSLHMGSQQQQQFSGGPMTASMAESGGGGATQFQQQQQAIYLQAQAQAQALQRMSTQGQNNVLSPEQRVLQMQYDLLQLQAMQQQQQFQAQLLAQAQMQQHQQAQAQSYQSALPRRRPSEPATAGPLTTSFPGSMLARGRAVSSNVMAESTPEYPMSAAIDGRFSGRSVSGLNPNAAAFKIGDGATSAAPAVPPTPSSTSGNWRSSAAAERSAPAPAAAVPMTPATPSFTTVISGGTSLGTGGPTAPATAAPPPAKHDTATSWRRPSVQMNKPIVLSSSPPSSNRASSRSSSPPSPPTVFVSTPEDEDEVISLSSSRSISPPIAAINAKGRPQPLRFSIPSMQSEDLPVHVTDGVDFAQLVTVNSDSDEDDADLSTPTPTTGSSAHSAQREEAAKRLYEGLGIGRPVPERHTVQLQPAVAEVNVMRQASALQPARQPRGPPSGVEDLGARNFAARIRQKAIGGLGALMDARERRDVGMEVQAY